MKILVLLSLALLPATALTTATTELDAPRDHFVTNRGVLMAAWLVGVEAPLTPEAIAAIEQVAAAVRHIDLTQGTAVHAGRMQLDCSSPTTGCHVDSITALPPSECITAQHVGSPGYAHHYVSNAATAEHSDQLISNHGHDDAYVAGAVCVRTDTAASNQVRADGVGVFL